MTFVIMTAWHPAPVRVSPDLDCLRFSENTAGVDHGQQGMADPQYEPDPHVETLPVKDRVKGQVYIRKTGESSRTAQSQP
jgi:hypothetical protein